MAKRKSSIRRRSTRRPRRRAKLARRRSARRVTRAKPVRRRSTPRAKTAKLKRRRAKSPRKAVRKRTSKREPPRARNGRPAPLQRERRRLPDAERLEPAQPIADPRMLSAARAGHDELRANLSRRTETSPTLTAGDVDAKWEDAAAVGDEAPGGDNPTPGQDRVDAIGRALGVQYRDDEELQGGDEIRKRDRNRWELDPASSEDWPHEKKHEKKEDPKKDR